MPPAPTPGSELTLAASSASAAQPTGAEATLAMSAGDATIASVRQSPRPADEALVPGARLGRYVLERLLGQGGMGTVYIAHDPDLDRKVAIKVLHTGVAATDATSGPQRLLREAQAMARLSHPNVVAVHDVGVVGSRLFIAMELIDGSDLRRWLAETKRPWQAIVEVFVAAGAGLAAAHDAGIIHRDFKPDNVLIARNGRVTVGDFGLAAATADAPPREDVSLKSWLGEAGTLTVPGAVMGTPAYMAPEQMDGGEITPAVDIFAFCVALHEAIHGQRPFRGDSIANLFLAIHSEEPAQSATRVPRRLTRALRRGLAASPGARQPSMHALLAELRPLIASRRRLWFGAAALVAVTAGAGAALWSASTDVTVCGGGEAAVAELWSPARREALQLAFTGSKVVHAANTWKLVATRIDAFAEAWSTARLDACEDTHLRGEQSTEALDRRMVCLDRQLRDLDRVLDFLAAPDPKIIDNAIALVRDLPAPAKCDAAAALTAAASSATLAAPELARLDEAITHARLLYRAGKYTQAIDELQPIIARLQELNDPKLLVRALTARAQAGYIDSRPESQTWNTAALEAALRTGDDARFADIAANQLGLVGAEAPARELWLRLGEAALQRHGGDDSTQAKLLTNYGNALRNDGRVKDAEVAHRAALELRRRDPDSPTLLADALFNVSAVLSTQERIPEALPLAHEAIDIWTRELGPQHPRMVTALSNLAVMAKRNADYDDATDLATRALDLSRTLRGEQHPDVGQQYALVASIENWRGDFVAAGEHFDRALAILKAAGPARAERTAGIFLTAASYRVDAGDLAGAEALLDDALKLDTKYPPGHPFWTGEASTRVQIALARGQLDTAERELQRERALLARSEQPDLLARLYLALYQAELDLHRNRIKEGLAVLEPLASEHPRELKHPYNRAQLEFLRARLLWQADRQREALSAAEQARALYVSLATGFAPRAAEVNAWIEAHAPP
ncbi:MAG: serine/threonine protein kinase [Nannocystis sp.]|uniref:protein kinase domain-containing protein n=1 Tax=Nannocystis sp. TaxID=1962667 RepID=UPI002423A732|nr:protein kinase [Nannocystis sp.]MBK9754046.1 serine/threonine protein kinase [Nannocystis sp.]